VLVDLLTVYGEGGKAIVFTQTKREADEVAASVGGHLPCGALHGDMSQREREKVLAAFRANKLTVLVATDVAARGLDIPDVDLVVHYELPQDPESFLHRSGTSAGRVCVCVLPCLCICVCVAGSPRRCAEAVSLRACQGREAATHDEVERWQKPAGVGTRQLPRALLTCPAASSSPPRRPHRSRGQERHCHRHVPAQGDWLLQAHPARDGDAGREAHPCPLTHPGHRGRRQAGDVPLGRRG
jgi:hypothetical protein